MAGRNGMKSGFALLTPERRREVSSKGGRAVHAQGRAFEWNSEQAAAAGRKGGKASKGGRAKILNNQ